MASENPMMAFGRDVGLSELCINISPSAVCGGAVERGKKVPVKDAD